jgi:hypothetical protein
MMTGQSEHSVRTSLPGIRAMNGPNRTFVLQAVGVAVIVGVIFFAFLRPSDVGDLSGIDASGDDGATAGVPGEGLHRGNHGRNRPRNDDRASNRPRRGVTSGSVGSGGLALPPAGDDPAGDQYTSTVAALMTRVMAPADP